MTKMKEKSSLLGQRQVRLRFLLVGLFWIGSGRSWLRSWFVMKEYGRRDLFFDIVRSGLQDRYPDTNDISRVMKFCAYANNERDFNEIQLPDFQEVIPEYIEELRAKPWWESAEFSWCHELEEKADKIRAEMLNVIRKERLFKSDSNYGSTMDNGWTAIRLQRKGMWDEGNIKKFPITMSVIESLRIPIASRGVMFARQLPQTGVKSHSDGRNFVLTAHLGLCVPEGECSITVAQQQKEWKEGKVIIFDTSFLHKTENNSKDQERIVLIIDFWHPDLSEKEQKALEFIYDTRNKFEAGHLQDIDCSYIRDGGCLDVGEINRKRKRKQIFQFFSAWILPRR